MVYVTLGDLPLMYRKALVEALQILKTETGIAKVLVFGSVARLDLHVGSDIDLIALTKYELGASVSAHLRSEMELLETGICVDLVVMSEEKFVSSQDRFIARVREEGLVLLEGGEFTNVGEQLL